MEINAAVAAALKAARTVRGISFEQIAEQSGVSSQTVYRMLNDRRDIKIPQLYSFCRVLGVSVIEILQDAERIQERASRQLQ